MNAYRHTCAPRLWACARLSLAWYMPMTEHKLTKAPLKEVYTLAVSRFGTILYRAPRQRWRARLVVNELNGLVARSLQRFPPCTLHLRLLLLDPVKRKRVDPECSAAQMQSIWSQDRWEAGDMIKRCLPMFLIHHNVRGAGAGVGKPFEHVVDHHLLICHIYWLW